MVNGKHYPVKGMSQAALGRALGLSPASVTKLKGQGMPVDSVAAAQAWREARQNLAQRKPMPSEAAQVKPYRQLDGGPYSGDRSDPVAGRISVGGVPVFGGGPVDFPELPDEDRDAARTRREISEANMAELMEAKQRRELIKVSAVQAQLATDYATTRDALLQIPARIAPLLAAETDPAKVQTLLHAEIHEALTTLAGSGDKMPQIEGAFD